MPSPANPSSLPVARPASDAVWFAPGADDLSRLPEKARVFEEVWGHLADGTWPRGNVRKANGAGRGDRAFADLAIDRQREQERNLEEIRREGFVWGGGDDEDGHFIPAFTELGRRTAISGAHLIRRIVAGTERRPLSGRGKGAVTRQLRKECAMFDDYVVLSAKVRGVIRIDNDQVWKSWADVHSWLAYLLKEGHIPCIPHMAVCKRSADGKIRKPHFLIFLPLGDEVRGDGRCKGRTRGLMHAVENGWIRALSGDAGGASNPRKIKNPTSPRMLVGIFNQSSFLTLGEMAETLDCSRPDDRRLAAERSGLDEKASNSIFTETHTAAWPKVAQLCDLGDARYLRWLADEELFAAGLFDVMMPFAMARNSGDKPLKAIEAIVWAVCRRVARDWDPHKVSRPPDRGVMGLPADMPLAGKDGKWAASGKWSSAKIMCETIEAMADEIVLIESSGRAARPVDLIEAGWAKATVGRRFDAAMLLSFYRSQPVEGKKGTPHPVEVQEVDGAAGLPTIMSISPSIEPAHSVEGPEQPEFDPCCAGADISIGPVNQSKLPIASSVLDGASVGTGEPTKLTMFLQKLKGDEGHARSTKSAGHAPATEGGEAGDGPASRHNAGVNHVPSSPGPGAGNPGPAGHNGIDHVHHSPALMCLRGIAGPALQQSRAPFVWSGSAQASQPGRVTQVQQVGNTETVAAADRLTATKKFRSDFLKPRPSPVTSPNSFTS